MGISPATLHAFGDEMSKVATPWKLIQKLRSSPRALQELPKETLDWLNSSAARKATKGELRAALRKGRTQVAYDKHLRGEKLTGGLARQNNLFIEGTTQAAKPAGQSVLEAAARPQGQGLMERASFARKWKGTPAYQQGVAARPGLKAEKAWRAEQSAMDARRARRWVPRSEREALQARKPARTNLQFDPSGLPTIRSPKPKPRQIALPARQAPATHAPILARI